MTIKSRNNLADNLNLDDLEIETFDALAKFFYSEQLTMSEPWTWAGCYDSEERKDEEYAWAVTKKDDCVGSLHFGRKHQYSVKKFYFCPNYELVDYYDYVLTECVPEEMRSSLWTEAETRKLLYSTSDTRSECRTY